MEIVSSIGKMQKVSAGLRREGRRIGLVPTMGALHEGHLSLIRKARSECDVVVVSVFVNPTQFGPSEDFTRYPRPFLRDTGLCRKERVDYLFHPSAPAMFPAGHRTFAEVRGLEDLLCGAVRPGHFKGVATVVLKLFNIVSPSDAYFGSKDYQQSLIIRTMAEDLNVPVTVKVLPIVREKDGLALSSRNAYMSAAQRQTAAHIPRAMKLAKNLFKQGVRDPSLIERKLKSFLKERGIDDIDYVSCIDPNDLSPVRKIDSPVRLALAVRVGTVRLIDNMLLTPQGH